MKHTSKRANTGVWTIATFGSVQIGTVVCSSAGDTPLRSSQPRSQYLQVPFDFHLCKNSFYTTRGTEWIKLRWLRLKTRRHLSRL